MLKQTQAIRLYKNTSWSRKARTCFLPENQKISQSQLHDQKERQINMENEGPLS